MKRLIFFGILFLSISISSAQGIQFPTSIVAAGGSNHSNSAKQISKWRIGHVNVLQVNSNSIKSGSTELITNIISESDDTWEITAFPNPVTDILHVQFNINESAPFCITVTDITGRIVIVTEEQVVIPRQTFELDLSHLISALYIINIRSSDHSLFKILKVTKI